MTVTKPSTQPRREGGKDIALEEAVVEHAICSDTVILRSYIRTSEHEGKIEQADG